MYLSFNNNFVNYVFNDTVTSYITESRGLDWTNGTKHYNLDPRHLRKWSVGRFSIIFL